MYNFKFADIGEGIHEGKILEYNYKVGAMIKEGETLVIIETDKVNAEIPVPVDGKIIELGPKVGEIVHVGETLAMIDEGVENDSSENNKEEIKESTPDENDEAGVVGKLEVSEEVIASAVQEKDEEAKSTRVLATPVARKLASDLGVNINDVKGTGEHGRVLRTDIENFKQSNTENKSQNSKITVPETKVLEGDRREKISSLRKSVVKAMTISKQIIPHTTLIDELDVTELVDFRNDYKEKAKTQGVKLTFMPFIIKALVKAIKEYPLFNSSYDQENEEIIYRKNINIGIAVDTPDGLIVPNIKNVDQLSLFDIANEVERLAKLAKERKIQLNELQNGTITITNFGAFDALSGTPVIKYPEVAILGIGKIMKKPVVINNEIVIRDIAPLSLTFDHRIIDGADGGRFMIAYKKYLKDPLLLLMSVGV
ncbi:MAG: dihydrolipoamide acetyltransferase family protein [Candidatus Izemoplasmatales bacterium]|nr:dihydrolipoamide acetyltransferase family protein [Candidatus Izemoplasmatales bacterium]